ncbi:hypothetical protein RHS04_03639 [Rhizoctonia solani]|uniref:Uncharacterized protein n=1 Tax=Rhizoctonia solani TaxID=456999 RepID=A0A8H7H917_9AGAM|nr:hypothetical protein RHS04_03639 [Rhizoctonia solani]
MWTFCDLTGACSESREDRFMPCRLASDPHRLASYTPSAAARLCVSFLSHQPSCRSRELVWAARPRSTLAASQPRGFPNLTGLGLVADADERTEDKSLFSPGLSRVLQSGVLPPGRSRGLSS